MRYYLLIGSVRLLASLYQYALSCSLTNLHAGLTAYKYANNTHKPKCYKKEGININHNLN